MIFRPQLTIPDKGDPFYNTKSNGGYSTAIIGKPTCDGLNVLSNCSGYACGRFHAIANDKTMSMLCPVNAEHFIDYKRKDLKVGDVPKLGACAVWQKGTSSGSDGAGHVAIVEQINADGSIVTSESGWNNTTPFWTKTRKNDGNWGQNSQYKFLGFIYQPVDYEPAPPAEIISFIAYPVKKGISGYPVKMVQTILKGLGYYSGTIDGIAGGQTDSAIKNYQRKRGLEISGCFGAECWLSFIGETAWK